METRRTAKLSSQVWGVPLILLAVCLLSYGVLSPWLGFYWDDWPAVWFLHLLGPSGFKEVFAIDRPLLGRLFMLTTPLLGESTLGWQLFGILTRWVSCLALWWTLRALWPQRLQQAAWISLLFAVYPGFKQQYIAVTYSHGWIILAAFIFSFGLMIWAVRALARRDRPGLFWPLIAFSWLLSALIMFTDEYFFGLEFLRPLVLWLVLGEQAAIPAQSAGLQGAPDEAGAGVKAETLEPASATAGARRLRSRLARLLAIWLPYLAVMLAFLVWRVFLQETPRGQVHILDQLRQAPFQAVFNLASTVIQDLFEVGVLAWVQTLNFTTLSGLSLPQLLAYLAVSLLTAGLVIYALLKLFPGAPDSGPDRRWAAQALLAGGLALFLGGWPFWATDLPIRLRFPLDRFTLPMMLGACLLLVGALEWIFRSRLQKAVLLGLAVGLAAGAHFHNGLAFRQDWQAQKDFFWQLTWRAPALQPGTTLLTTALPLDYYTDNSLTGPLNWVYAPDLSSKRMPYLLADLEVRLGLAFTGLERGLPVEQPYRAASFSGSTSQAVVLWQPTGGCLQVLDPRRDLALPLKEDLLSRAIPLSNLDAILPAPGRTARPPAQIFGPEPDHGWCYYFEKAELARQAGDWQSVAGFAERAFELANGAEHAREFLPFIEGYARTGNWEQARQLTLQSLAALPSLRPTLCSTWQSIAQATASSHERETVLAAVTGELDCSVP